MIVILVGPYSMSPSETGIPLVHCHWFFLGVTYSIGICQELTVLLAHQRLRWSVEGWIGRLDWDAPVVGQCIVKVNRDPVPKEIQRVIIFLWSLLPGGGSINSYLTVSILIDSLKMSDNSKKMCFYLLLFIMSFLFLLRFFCLLILCMIRFCFSISFVLFSKDSW